MKRFAIGCGVGVRRFRHKHNHPDANPSGEHAARIVAGQPSVVPSRPACSSRRPRRLPSPVPSAARVVHFRTPSAHSRKSVVPLPALLHFPGTGVNHRCPGCHGYSPARAPVNHPTRQPRHPRPGPAPNRVTHRLEHAPFIHPLRFAIIFNWRFNSHHEIRGKRSILSRVD